MANVVCTHFNVMCLFNFHVSSTRLTTVSFLLKYTIVITTTNLVALTLLPLEVSGRMEGVGGKGGVPMGIFLSRTLEQQMIWNWNFVIFNIFFMVNKVLQNFLRKNLPIALNDSFFKSLWQHFYVFLLHSNFIGNYEKIYL